jgi:hypothetical protein
VSAAVAVLVITRRACEWLAEVRLCELEVAARARRGMSVFAVQTAVTLAVAGVLAAAPEHTLVALAVFAVAPLVGATPRPRVAAFRGATLVDTLKAASPYIGSTAVDGVSTYVLRLVVFLVAGREMSGMLFTAFVIGSFAATLFANVFGPTIALSRSRNPAARHGLLVGSGAAAMGMAGVGLAAASLATDLADWFGRPGYFWLALGLSLLGGAVMVGAQWIRLRLFDERRGELLFGPDVLRSITIIIAAPTLYYLVGPSAVGALYLLTALLTAFAYWGAGLQRPFAEQSPALARGLAVALLVPVFFLLGGQLYHSPGAALLDPGGGVMSVPLPLALPACFAGLLLLASYRQAALSLGTVFFLFVAMVLATVMAAQGSVADDLRKFVLLFQYLVPVFALVLGQMWGATGERLRDAAVGFSLVLMIFVPAQLVRSFGYGDHQLRHDLWGFSVYQHLQYVPAVFVGAFLFVLMFLWRDRFMRQLHMILAPLMAYYAASSRSLLAIALVASGAVVLAIGQRRDTAARVCSLLMIVGLGVHVYVSDSLSPVLGDPGRVSAPIEERLYYWKLFGSGIAESGRAFLFGHARTMDRALAPSAHNYYLDFVYNFGVLAFLPLAWLIAYTLILSWRNRSSIGLGSPLIGLALAVAFMLGLDNMFKVPLRQPYSGIFFFFLWGLLIARLRAAERTAGGA